MEVYLYGGSDHLSDQLLSIIVKVTVVKTGNWKSLWRRGEQERKDIAAKKLIR